MKRSQKCPSCSGRIVRGKVVLLAGDVAIFTVVCATCASRAVSVLAPHEKRTTCEQCGSKPAAFCRTCVISQVTAAAVFRKVPRKFPLPTPAKPEDWK